MKKKKYIYATPLCSILLCFSLMLGGNAHALEENGNTTEKYLIPAGETVGIKLFSEGVIIVGFSEEKNGELSPAKNCGLREGDILLEFNGTKIQSTEHLQALLQENGAAKAALNVKRKGRKMEVFALPAEGEDGVYRIGAWIRDSMAGIGTMTFYDPENGTFGALGHGVTDIDTAQLMPLDSGSIMEASVKAVKRGESGSPGELRGNFNLTEDLGELSANTDRGIFGSLYNTSWSGAQGDAYPVGTKEEVKIGKASILSTCEGNKTEEYDIEIEKIYNGNTDVRNFLIHVTDASLLQKTGGIVQGMSGSPILQNGKIIGAVTHVLINDPTRGYGIFIENMLDAAGK